MPKLRTPVAELQNRTIVANIKYGMEMTGVSPDELALAMRTTTKTVYSRFKHPEEFRIRELRAISKKLHVPIEQLITGKPT
jgi:hypothetical protein